MGNKDDEGVDCVMFQGRFVCFGSVFVGGVCRDVFVYGDLGGSLRADRVDQIGDGDPCLEVVFGQGSYQADRHPGDVCCFFELPYNAEYRCDCF